MLSLPGEQVGPAIATAKGSEHHLHLPKGHCNFSGPSNQEQTMPSPRSPHHCQRSSNQGQATGPEHCLHLHGSKCRLYTSIEITACTHLGQRQHPKQKQSLFQIYIYIYIYANRRHMGVFSHINSLPKRLHFVVVFPKLTE